MVRLYNRFITMDQSRLNKKIFMYDKSARGHNWNKKVKKILNDYNMLNYWQDDLPVPLDVLSTRTREQFNRDWEHNCSTKPKLRTYVTFKDKLEVASHVNCNMPKYDRSLISQLRLGILPLRIETGRFSNLDEEERTCLVCNSGEIENEKHFLFECDFYLSERNRLENDIECNFANLDLKDKFKTIFEHPFRLAKYVKSAFLKRRQKIYNSV